MTDTPTLGDYEGREITGTTIEVRKVGGGLHDPLAIDPEIIHVGDKRVLCLPVVCVDVKHGAEDRTEPSEGGVIRGHVFDAEAAFFIDPTVIAEARLKHLEKVALAEKERDRAKRAAKAQGRTVADPKQAVLDVDREAMEKAHLDGDHKGGQVEGCPSCEWEDDLEARERAADAIDDAIDD